MSKMIIVKDHEDCRERLTFRDVKVGQLFVCLGGNLHQKVAMDHAHRITFPDGKLYCYAHEYAPVFYEEAYIAKILDVTHIEY